MLGSQPLGAFLLFHRVVDRQTLAGWSLGETAHGCDLLVEPILQGSLHLSLFVGESVVR